MKGSTHGAGDTKGSRRTVTHIHSQSRDDTIIAHALECIRDTPLADSKFHMYCSKS